MDLSTARALVTGGGTGIGLATARLLRERGARVAVVGRRRDVLERAAAKIGATAVAGDVSVEADAERVVAEAADALGGLDVLVNNAGLGRFGNLVDVTAGDMRAAWETNVLGATLVARECARRFVAQGGGHIVNVASTAGSRGYAGGSAYSSTKFALTALTECWRAELRQHNVRVMQVNPSEVVTEFFEAAGMAPHPDNPTKLHPEDIAHVIAGMLTLNDRGFVTQATIFATNPRG